MTGRVPSLGSTLREYRRRAGLTQDEAATAAGISVRTLRDLEQDRASRPRRRSLAALAEALRMPAGSWERYAAPPGTGALSVAVLGPLVVRRGDTGVELPGALPRRLLTLLALHPGETVGRDRILEALWPDTPPASAPGLVHSYVATVRRALEPGRTGAYRMLVRAGDGYRLDVAPDDLDLAAFRAGVAAARAADRPAGAEQRLRAALALWRGPVAADEPALAGLPAVAAIAAERLDATLRHADLALELGVPDRAVAALQALAADEPLHEGLHVRLIRALAASGAQSAALRCYDDLRRRLADELGVDPTAELRAAHAEVLQGRHDPGTPPDVPVPAQLPPGGRYFTGRTDQLAQLDAVAERLDTGGAAVVISAVTGAAGVGKTALALHWAHRAADRFADGQLYVNLRGFDPAGPADPADVLRGMLEALGTPPGRVPPDAAARSAMLRSLLARRRVLLVLDNARDADQVRPLLPGAAGCLAIVTSRDRMAGLVVTDGAVPVPLDLLTTAEARELLARRIGAARVAAEPEAIGEIVARCAHLPLALAVVAARAATQPRLSLRALAAELAAARLDALATGDLPSDVRAVFSWSYAALPATAQRLFRLLAVHPGPAVSAEAADTLAGTADARGALAELVRVNLLEDAGDGRYTVHELLRQYAAELLGPAERGPAFRRLVDHYVHAADAADRHLYPHRRVVAVPDPAPGVAVPRLPDADAAAAWFTAELSALTEITRQAAAAGLDDRTWHLAWAATVYRSTRSLHTGQLELLNLAIEAARRSGDRGREATSHTDLGMTLSHLRRYDDAAAELRRALTLAEEIGDAHVRGRAHLSLGRILDQTGDLPAALAHAERAGEAFREAGDRVGEGLALNGTGWVATRLGDHRRALTATRAALELAEQAGDRGSIAAALDSVGYSHHQLGEYAQARDSFKRALALLADAGDRRNAAEVLEHLAETEAAAGATTAAREAADQAIEILTELDPDRAEALRTRAAGYGAA
jgi:DNA-binding SARP family transcriptional activator/DNA-binding XRE family transcriptional regulator